MSDPTTCDPTTETDDTEIGGYVALGDDSDCETCGSSYNSVEWYYDGTQVELRTSIGCYGGEGLATSDLDEAAAFIVAEAARFPDAAAELAAEVDRMRAAVTAART